MKKPKNLFDDAEKLRGRYNPDLDNLEIRWASTERMEETNRLLSKVKMPDAYYEQQRKKAEGK